MCSCAPEITWTVSLESIIFLFWSPVDKICFTGRTSDRWQRHLQWNASISMGNLLNSLKQIKLDTLFWSFSASLYTAHACISWYFDIWVVQWAFLSSSVRIPMVMNEVQATGEQNFILFFSMSKSGKKTPKSKRTFLRTFFF